MWGVQTEIFHHGNAYKLDSTAKRERDAAYRRGQSEALKDPAATSNQRVQDAKVELDHLQLVQSELRKRNRELHHENNLLRRAIQRNRAVYLRQRKREHRATVSWTSVVTAGVSLAALGVFLYVLSGM